MKDYRKKFLVYNLRDLDLSHEGIDDLITLIDRHVQRNRLARRVNPSPTYYVCNADEPYAEDVLDLILDRKKPEDVVNENDPVAIQLLREFPRTLIYVGNENPDGTKEIGKAICTNDDIVDAFDIMKGALRGAETRCHNQSVR